MSSQPLFKSKVGLVAATVGSAVGLGNVWRFPAEAQAGGGAAFLLLYVLCVFLLGIPVMLAEFSIGRAGGTDAVGSFKRLAPGTKWWWTGGLTVLTAYLILCFYMVVAGWTFEYMWQSVTGGLFSSVDGGQCDADAQFSARMREFTQGNFAPVINTFIMIVLNLAVLLAGVAKGIERLSNVLMPLLFVLLLVFCGVSLTLPGAGAGVEFFLKPDFSKITPAVCLNALGQAFFSLSLGMGILITYASYYPKSTKLTQTATTVAVLDLFVSVLMGIIIFPAVMSFGLQEHSVEGPTLVFVTLPEVFAQLPGTRLWSALFFLLLTVAALTSTISISEVPVKFIQDRWRTSRAKACLIVMVPLFVLSAVCALASGPLDGVRIFGQNIFDFLNNVTSNVMLPVAAIATCLFLGWFAPRGLFRSEMTNGESMRSRVYGISLFIIRYLAPVLIVFVLVAPLF